LARKEDVNWVGWSRYYVGRGLELFGLALVTFAMLLFFGSNAMRPMLAMTGAGLAFFFVGWLLARKHPDEKKP
jgi:hypothetical protein